MSEESRKHNSHAAESWRELAGDVRQWADGHRLAITATVALVVLNLVVWLVVAMAGFAFPLRLDTSMAEFDFGKLFCTLFLARGVIQLILDAVLWLVMLSIAEPWLGRARTVGTALACALGGVIVGLTLCAAAGWLFQDSQFVSRMQFALSPLVLPVGALMAASAFCSHLLRRRIRLIGYVAILVALLYSGNPGDSRRRADRTRGRPRDGRAARACRDRLALAAQHLLRGAAHVCGHRRGAGAGADHRHHLA